MKRCPVCQTMLFEDMDICYGCLHRFPEGDDPAGEGAIDADRERQALKSANLAADLPQIEMKPAPGQIVRGESSLASACFADVGAFDCSVLDEAGSAASGEAGSVDSNAAGPAELNPVDLVEAGRSVLTGVDADWIMRLELRCPDEPSRSWIISLSHPPQLLVA